MEKFISPRSSSIILSLGYFVLRKRWLVFAIGTTLVVLVEALEHWPLRLEFNAHFLREIVIYGLLGPGVVWLLLRFLDHALHPTGVLDQVKTEATNAERRRIARDLHDNLAQNLGYLHFKLDNLASTEDITLESIQSIQAELGHMRQIADHAYEEVRDTLRSLRPKLPTSDDFTVALRHQMEQLMATSAITVAIDCQCNTDKLCRRIQQTMLAILQEATNNAAQHAQARQVIITLSRTDDTAVLTINDDGNGFDLAEGYEKPGHFGLSIMRERAEENGGHLTIESEPGRGTRLSASFPHAFVTDQLLQHCRQTNCQHILTCTYAHSLS